MTLTETGRAWRGLLDDSSGDSMQRLWRGRICWDSKRASTTLAGTSGRPWRGRRRDLAEDSGGRLRTTLPLAKRAWRTLARTTRRTTLAVAGEDVAATVTHHSDVPVTLPNIATSVRLVQHGEGEEAEHKIRSSPASGGCGWVPRYEDGATHDHFMGGARRGTVTHPKP